MSEFAFDEQAAHRFFAVHCNNTAWDLLESTTRSTLNDERILIAAYAALYHWLAVGNSLNEQRARHLLATVHAELSHVSLAQYQANICMALSESNSTLQTPFDRACAFECLARAQASAKRSEDAKELRDKAEHAAVSIDESEREIFAQMLNRGCLQGIK